ncbi:MAG: GNAT family N-acetyltransferase [Erysipelotrichaceae bacterium]|nr:GNAT family N-acetyltransferase [Erysipelotrichaceae bacterium]
MNFTYKPLRTKRLLIRKMDDSDSKKTAILLSNRQVTEMYMVPDYNSAEGYMDPGCKIAGMSPDETRFVRGIFLDDILIGIIHDVEISDYVELGYVLNPKYWNQGYMSETLNECIRYLFAYGIGKVRAGVFEENTASIRVMEKCNMKRIPTEESIIYQGITHEVIYYEIEKV